MAASLSIVDGSILRCYACGAAAAATGPPGVDLVLERASWPRVPCPVTPGCPGDLVPEALN